MNGVLLRQVACEFIAASHKLEPQGLSPQAAWQRLSEFAGVFLLVLPTADVLERAGALHIVQHWSLWDAMIVAGCLDCGVQRLYSEDMPGNTAPAGLEIVNPFVL